MSSTEVPPNVSAESKAMDPRANLQMAEDTYDQLCKLMVVFFLYYIPMFMGAAFFTGVVRAVFPHSDFTAGLIAGEKLQYRPPTDDENVLRRQTTATDSAEENVLGIKFRFFDLIKDTFFTVGYIISASFTLAGWIFPPTRLAAVPAVRFGYGYGKALIKSRIQNLVTKNESNQKGDKNV